MTGTAGSALHVSRSAGGVTTTTRGLLLTHALKHSAGSRADTSTIVRFACCIDQFSLAVGERVIALDLVGGGGALSEHAAVEALGGCLGAIEGYGLVGLLLGRRRAAARKRDRGKDQQSERGGEDSPAWQRAHASFLDSAMPAVDVIARGPPITARPIGQRRAMQRLFSIRVTETRSP